jgi:hypothetical protein
MATADTPCVCPPDPAKQPPTSSGDKVITENDDEPLPQQPSTERPQSPKTESPHTITHPKTPDPVIELPLSPHTPCQPGVDCQQKPPKPAPVPPLPDPFDTGCANTGQRDWDNDHKCDWEEFENVVTSTGELQEFSGLTGAWVSCDTSTISEGKNMCTGSYTYTAQSVQITGSINVSGGITQLINLGFTGETTYTFPSISVTVNFRISLGYRTRAEVYNLFSIKSGYVNRIWRDADGITRTEKKINPFTSKTPSGRSLSMVIGVCPNPKCAKR